MNPCNDQPVGWCYQIARPAPDLAGSLGETGGTWERLCKPRFSRRYKDGPNIRNQRPIYDGTAALWITKAPEEDANHG